MFTSVLKMAHKIFCKKCSQTFVSKKSFVFHLVSKNCFKSVGEAAKSSTRYSRHKEEVAQYPTREFVPIQGCAGCRRYSRPGLQMYMISHLATHVHVVNESLECYYCEYETDKQKVLDKHQNSEHPSKTEEEKLERNEEQETLEDDLCSSCDMAFEDAEVLAQHNSEIHA